MCGRGRRNERRGSGRRARYRRRCHAGRRQRRQRGRGRALRGIVVLDETIRRRGRVLLLVLLRGEPLRVRLPRIRTRARGARAVARAGPGEEVARLLADGLEARARGPVVLQLLHREGVVNLALAAQALGGEPADAHVPVISQACVHGYSACQSDGRGSARCEEKRLTSRTGSRIHLRRAP